MSLLEYNEGALSSKHFFRPDEAHAAQTVALFKHENVLDDRQSILQKKPVVKTIEVCELRFAQNPNYIYVAPAGATYRTINGVEITFAEYYADQYQAFHNGDQQHAIGTPLAELARFGATPSQLSLLRARNIHTIESLLSLQGQARKSLGVIGNDVIPMAAKWDEARKTALGADVVDQIKLLQEEVQRLREAAGAEIVGGLEDADDSAPIPADDPFPDQTNDDLKTMIAERFGQRPRGNPSRQTLIETLTED